jgi:hydrogenase expression/formation protein HypE
VRADDVIILSGDLGRHGIAVMSVREGLEFESPILSDCAALADPIRTMLENRVELHCLRDLTRGGLASALNEIAMDGHVGIDIQEGAIPACEPVAAACELLGLDPLYVANEGRFVAFVAEHDSQRAVSILRSCGETTDTRIIGRVRAAEAGCVVMQGSLGNSRVLDLLAGEQLPRIC